MNKTEAKKMDTYVALSLGFEVKTVALCNMLEINSCAEIFINDNKINLHFRPFEVKTLRPKI